jgi:hypothetical protein
MRGDAVVVWCGGFFEHHYLLAYVEYTGKNLASRAAVRDARRFESGVG